MVQVLLHVPDGHVLEQSVICSKDVVHPGTDLSSVPLNSPCTTNLQLRLMTWEEVQSHVYQTCRRELVRNSHHPWCDFWIHQVGIEIADQQELGPVRLIPDG